MNSATARRKLGKGYSIHAERRPFLFFLRAFLDEFPATAPPPQDRTKSMMHGGMQKYGHSHVQRPEREIAR